MTISAKILKAQIDSRLAAGGLSSLSCCQLQNAQTILNTNAVISVASISALPSASLNTGRLIYVTNISEYRYSDGVSWSDSFDSTKYENQLWTWGRGYCGRLGDGAVSDRCSPVREISSSKDWCQVAASRFHTSAVKASGQLWSWGQNSVCGQLGDGTTTSKCSPVREISSSTDWCQVGVGVGFSSAIKTSGQLWSWGYGLTGTLGDGTTLCKCSPVREISSSTDWCQVGTTFIHIAAIKTSGQLWSWGFGGNGRLGDGTTVNKFSPVREISSSTDWCQAGAGNTHTIALKTTGQIWAWGQSSSGQLGNGIGTIDRCSPVREFCSATDWCQVSAGGYGSAALKTSGQLWSWGTNSIGTLGDGTTVSRCSPVREFCSATDWCQVSVGYCHTAAIKTSGQLWSWGSGNCGRLGDGTGLTSRCSPVREITSSTDWRQVAAGACTTAAVKNKVKGFL